MRVGAEDRLTSSSSSSRNQLRQRAVCLPLLFDNFQREVTLVYIETWLVSGTAAPPVLPWMFRDQSVWLP